MLKQIGLAALAAMVIGTGTARAALVTLDVGESATFGYDGTNSVPSCPACTAEVKLTVLSTTSLQFDIKNTSSDLSPTLNILTALGFDFTPDVDFTGATAVFSSGFDWKIGTAGMGNLEFQAGAVNGVNDGLDAGQMGSITLTLGPTYDPPGPNGPVTPVISVPLDVDETAVHFQALADGGSIKPGGVCTDCVSVPDGGMTLSLLGLGLAGMGMLRRRLQ